MKLTTALTILTVLLAQQTGRGDIAPPGSVASRFVQAECVVVGKVTEIEEKTVKVTYPGGKDPVEFKVGVVKIEHLGKGDKGLTHVKVCFLPTGATPPRRPQTSLKVDQEVVLFLQKHPDEPYYFCPGFYGQVSKGGFENIDTVVAQVKQCSRFLAEPDAALKSKDAKDRLLATAVLLSSYRRVPGPGAKTEPLSAEQSKAILKTLNEADWTTPDPVLGWDMKPHNMFLMLGLTKDDGWVQPAEGKDFTTEAKKWLKDNQDTYRVKKFVK